MQKYLMALSALSLMVPAATLVAPPRAEAREKTYQPRVYTRNGKTYCRHSNGTVGLIAGGVGGALVGRSIDTRGDRTVGTLLGAVGGAFAGRAIDRTITADKRCR
ncbi:MAG: glycine zipper 2TM domain-containing protein [Sphingomonas sp.]